MMKPIAKRERNIEVAGGHLSCSIYGEADPKLIVIHGGPGLGSGYLSNQMQILGELTTTLFYDQRETGHSKSTKDWQNHPLETYIADLHQLIETLKLPSVTLLAHSWGGILASAYALAHPERVDGIIYLNSVPLSDKEYLAFVTHRSQVVDTHNPELADLRDSEAFKKGDSKTVEQYFRLHFSSYFANPKQASDLSFDLPPWAGRNIFPIFQLFSDYFQHHPFDFYRKLATFNNPVLIIAGEKDVISTDYAHELQQTLPNSQLHILKNCGHFPYIEQASKLYPLIAAFLKKLEVGNGFFN